jgi:hypothetical protein
MNNPFDGGGSFGGNPFTDPKTAAESKICCPQCKSQNFHAFTTQYGLIRRCNECKNTWSGGTVVPPQIGRMDISGLVPPPGVPAPDEAPLTQYTGAEFRNPAKNTNGDE